MYRSINSIITSEGIVPMIREGKKAVAGRAKPAKTISPVKAQTTGTVPADTETAVAAVVSKGVCHAAKQQHPLPVKVRELPAAQAVTLGTVPCCTVDLQMQSANCIEGSREWNLETLFHQTGEMS